MACRKNRNTNFKYKNDFIFTRRKTSENLSVGTAYPQQWQLIRVLFLRHAKFSELKLFEPSQMCV